MKLAHLLAATALCSTPAFAQSLPNFMHEGSSVTLGFNFHNDDDDDPFRENFTTSLTGTSRYALSDSFGIGVTLGYNRETYQTDFYSSRFFLDLNPYYTIGEGEIGAFYTVMSYVDDSDNRENHSQYGFAGSQSYNNFTFEGYAGRLDQDGSLSNTVGIGLGYDVNDNLGVYYVERRDYSLGGNFYFGLVTLGVSYDFDDMISSSLPLVVSAEYSRFTGDDTSFGESEWDQFSVVATYQFGGGADSMFRGVRSVDFFYD